MSYIKKTKPRKAIPPAAKSVHRVLIESLSQWTVNCPSNINYRVVIVEDVNPFLFSEIYRLGKRLLLNALAGALRGLWRRRARLVMYY